MTAKLPKPRPIPRKLLAHTGLDVDHRQLIEWTHDRPDQGVETLTIRVAVLEKPPCPCRRSDKLGHYEPACPDYCNRCNYNTHICPGCGDYASHNQPVCKGCQEDDA